MIDFGEKVYLDTFGEFDSKIVREWRNDFSIWKWCRQNDLIPWENHKSWIESIGQNPSIKMYAVRAKGPLDSGDPVVPWASDDIDHMVGVVGLTSIDMLSRRAEFSCYTAPRAQKQGYAKAALKTLFSHGFSNLGLNNIWGETFDGNPAAKLFESIGMKLEGTRRAFYFKKGQFIDAHLYSLLRSEWDGLEIYKKEQA